MNYHIFVSHAWKYNDDYNTIINWLNNSDISYSNYSVPEHDPVDANNTSKLKTALTNQINPSSIVIVIGGMYAAHSEWIDYELDESIRLSKKIIGIRPRGQERIPSKLTNNATIMVNWNSNSLISAIKNI